MNNLFTKDDILSISKCCSEYKLVPWLNFGKLDWDSLCLNPNAVHYIEEWVYGNANTLYNINEFRWKYLCSNPNTLHLIELYKNNIHWDELCTNPNALHLIEEQLKKDPATIDWNFIYENPNAVYLFEKLKKTNLYPPLLFSNPNAIHLVEGRVERSLGQGQVVPNSTLLDIKHDQLYSNPNAVHLIEKEIKELTKCEQRELTYKECSKLGWIWCMLCSNPGAIHLIEERINYESKNNHIEFVDWNFLFRNPNAIHLIKKKIKELSGQYLGRWDSLSTNPSIFELEKINTRIKDIIYIL
jgi:hypothetical protein